MGLPERGEKGFTLIELLIVVAILGVLAAVVIPNVGRFIGRGETESAATELASIQSAMVAMMVDQSISSLPTANFSDHDTLAEATNNMAQFPQTTTDGINLYGYGSGVLINYVVTQNTTGTYYVNAQGTVFQASTGYD